MENKQNSQQYYDILMWVGSSYYTIESFIKEAKRFGVCKRINRIPDKIKIGKSRIFFAHNISKSGKLDTPVIFAYSKIEGILVVGEKAKEAIEKEGIKDYQYVPPDKVSSFQKRGCGFLHIDGIYLVSDKDMEKLQKYADSVTGQIFELDPWVEFPYPRFRGIKYVYGDKILSGKNNVMSWFPVFGLKSSEKCSILKCHRKITSKSKRFMLCRYHLKILKKIIQNRQIMTSEELQVYNHIKKILAKGKI